MVYIYRLILLASFTICLSTAASAQFVCGPTGTYSLLGVNVTIASPGSSAAAGGLACGSTSTAAVNATAVGFGSNASGIGSVSFGQGSQASGAGSLALGTAALGTGVNATAVGVNASANGNDSLAIGSGSSASGSNSVAIGSGVTTSTANQVAIGTAANTYRLAGVASSASVTAQVGPVKVVTTDNAGNIAAVDPSTLLGGPSFDPSAINAQLANHETRLENVERKVSQANRGVAAAMALAGGATLPAGKSYAVAASWGTFAGENAFGTSAIAALRDGLYMSGGVAVAGSDVGGRAGVSVAW